MQAIHREVLKIVNENYHLTWGEIASIVKKRKLKTQRGTVFSPSYLAILKSKQLSQRKKRRKRRALQ